MLRRVLDGLYSLSGFLGALCLAAIALIIFAQMVARGLGHQIRGADDLTAWAVAAGAMFSLAYSFRYGAHIRVSLLVDHLKGGPRRVLEIVCLLAGLAIVVALAVAAGSLVFDSWRYNDIAPGLLRIPMWIPQTTMLVGSLFFAVAILDDLVAALSGRETSYQGAAKADALERIVDEI